LAVLVKFIRCNNLAKSDGGLLTVMGYFDAVSGAFYWVKLTQKIKKREKVGQNDTGKGNHRKP
jgi:hypothetical protein